MEARVGSQSSFIVQLGPAGSKERVKFSSGEGSFETFISMRAKSYFSPGYGMPHSPVCLLMIRVHLVGVDSVNNVYLPAGTLLPPTITSTFGTNDVASSAPTRQTSPNGTSSPKIL